MSKISKDEKKGLWQALEIIDEDIDNCICTFEIEMYGKPIEVIPVNTVHQLIENRMNAIDWSDENGKTNELD